MKWELRLHARPGTRRLKTAAPALRFMANVTFPFNTTTSEERGGQRYMLGAINKWDAWKPVCPASLPRCVAE